MFLDNIFNATEKVENQLRRLMEKFKCEGSFGLEEIWFSVTLTIKKPNGKQILSLILWSRRRKKTATKAISDKQA